MQKLVQIIFKINYLQFSAVLSQIFCLQWSKILVLNLQQIMKKKFASGSTITKQYISWYNYVSWNYVIGLKHKKLRTMTASCTRIIQGIFFNWNILCCLYKRIKYSSYGIWYTILLQIAANLVIIIYLYFLFHHTIPSNMSPRMLGLI